MVGRLFDERHLYGSGRLLGHFWQYAPSQRRINMLYQETENPHFHSQKKSEYKMRWLSGEHRMYINIHTLTCDILKDKR